MYFIAEPRACMNQLMPGTVSDPSNGPNPLGVPWLEPRQGIDTVSSDVSTVGAPSVRAAACRRSIKRYAPGPAQGGIVPVRSKRSPQGLRPVHSKLCPARKKGHCTCSPSWEANVWLNRDRRSLYKPLPTKVEAQRWRRAALAANDAGTLRSPSTQTLAEASAIFLAGMKDGTIRSRTGEPYKPSAIRSYERCLRLRIVP